MVETVTVAALSANTPAQNAVLVQNAMAAARSQAKVILMPGRQAGAVVRYGAFACTANITDFPVTLKAEDKNNPPLCIAFAITGNERTGPLNTTTGNRATSVQNLTIDGLHWHAPRVSRVKRPDNTFYNFQDDDLGLGFGWHMTPEIDGWAGYYDKGPKGSIYGGFIMCLQGLGNAPGLTIQNCYFSGYNRIIDIPSGNNIKIRHNTFTNWHEDCIFIGGGSNITIEYNLWTGPNCLSLRDAYYGFGYGSGGGGPKTPGTQLPSTNPPHSDMVQLYGKTTNVIMRYNEQYDTTGRAHLLLAKIEDQNSRPTNSEFHVGLVCENNYGVSTHGNGLWFIYCNAPVIRRNKGLRTPNSNFATPSLAVGRYAGVASNPPYPPAQRALDVINPTVTNNVYASMGPKQDSENVPASWDFTGNRQTSTVNDMPTGWVEFRVGETAAGVPYAGQYGGTGEVVVVTPPGLTSGQVSFRSLVPGPSLPASDARRTFTINIPSGSPARDAFEIQWSSDADSTLRAMAQEADSGANEVWRAVSSDSGHLRLPNASFTNVKLYYRLTEGGALSDPSSYTFTETVPYVGEPDPQGVRLGNLDITKRLITSSGDYYQLRTARGIRWTRRRTRGSTGGGVILKASERLV